MWLEQNQWKAERKQYSMFLHKLPDKLGEKRKKDKTKKKICQNYSVLFLRKSPNIQIKIIKSYSWQEIAILTTVYLKYIIAKCSESIYSSLHLVFYRKTLALAQWNFKRTIKCFQLAYWIHVKTSQLLCATCCTKSKIQRVLKNECQNMISNHTIARKHLHWYKVRTYNTFRMVYAHQQ